ncbi:MAG: hypothetical protein LBU94_02125 [Clostridiales bacterium]|jgi:hypothetical protein|nr:hypothetical protein [Clostridiales bacterium]
MDYCYGVIKYADNARPLTEFIKKMPRFIYKWYISKYCNISVNEVSTGGYKGFEILINAVKNDVVNDTYLKGSIAGKILNKAYENNIISGVCPAELEDKLMDGLYIPKGHLIKRFLLKKIIDRHIKSIKLDKRYIEYAVIEGEPVITRQVLFRLYPGVNNLSLILEGSDKNIYERAAGEIFDDSGLNINFGGKNSDFLKEADIIINLSENSKSYASFFKRGACYIELAENKEKLKRLMGTRQDMYMPVVSKVNVGREPVDINLYEAVVFSQLPEFRAYVKGNISSDIIEVAYEFVKDIGISK